MRIDLKGKTEYVQVMPCLRNEFDALFNCIIDQSKVKAEDKLEVKSVVKEMLKKKAERAENIKRMMNEGRNISKEDMLFLSRLKMENNTDGENFISPFHQTLIIVLGDSNFGKNDIEYYKEKLEYFNKVMSYNDTYVAFIRGNDDDPAFFNGQFVYTNVMLVEDYTVISTNKHNILCIGGAVSSNREWKKKQEERISKFANRKYYYEDEAPVYNAEKLQEAIQSAKIDIVCTHTSPSFTQPQTKKDVSVWCKADDKISDDCIKERIVFDKVFNTIRENGITPTAWFYSHFRLPYNERRSDVIFFSINNTYSSIDDAIKIFVNKEKANKVKNKDFLDVDMVSADEDNNDEGANLGNIGEEVPFYIPEPANANQHVFGGGYYEINPNDFQPMRVAAGRRG